MEFTELGRLVSAVAIPLSIGFIGSFFNSGGSTAWYKQLNKPPWTPPNWAFPVVWTILYALMGVASWLVWSNGGFEKQRIPLGVYFFQLLLNAIWTPLFFGLQRPGIALVDIVLLWVSVVATIYLFWNVSYIAAYLLAPYILWVSVALSLNLYIWLYNGDSQKGAKDL